ncbi:MAG TPA: 4Fe-4S dicluster domain-containing protein [Actinobacteria bacterium]|nr:4Fe-4S dicluster domain-containing protein [Actinomycetota bacterium]
MKTVFVNPQRCIGCRQCEFACAVEHSRSKDPFLAIFENPPPKPRIHVEPGPWMGSSFPNRCHHCDPAPCLQVCPTGAIGRNDQFGVVLVDIDKCIACAMCAMVCPFAAITFHLQANAAAPRVVSTKCDGCFDRIRRDEEPACVEVCKVDALVYGELNDLLREERIQKTALAINATTGVAPMEPDTLAGWRGWGKEVARVAGGI